MEFKITELASDGKPFIAYAVEGRDEHDAIQVWLRRTFIWGAAASVPNRLGVFLVTGPSPDIPRAGIAATIAQQRSRKRTVEQLAPIEPRGDWRRGVTWQIGDLAKRLDNGREVYITDVKPNGLRVFYVTQDRETGHTSILEGTQLRPAVLKV